jgi:hypothetical protein
MESTAIETPKLPAEQGRELGRLSYEIGKRHTANVQGPIAAGGAGGAS